MGGGGGGGAVVERKRKKKKGRPSLLDLQKRSLRLQKQQQQQQQLLDAPNPNTTTTTTTTTNLDNDEEEEDEAGGSRRTRREKKLKLVLSLPPDSDRRADSSGSDDGAGSAQAERRNASSKTTDPSQGGPSDSGPTTPLPDKKLLEFILDRLQKKDTYGVFSDPVDPEELPDYHEIIDHPMDFSTIRKKLTGGNYANLEQFEKDVFLICSNAMHYNAPDTIFFRQARSIQELAKKDFENLRQESDDCEPEEKVIRKGRPPSKNLAKKPVGRPPTERADLEISSHAILTTAADNACHYKSSNNQLTRGFASEKPSNIDLSARPSQALRNLSADLRNEKNEGFSGSVLKGTSTRYGRNVIVSDDNRRSTYLESQTSGYGHEPSVLTIFDGERRQMMPVGLHVEHSYTRSLARFAANFGPVGWEIAARLIKKALPPGTKFGHGWVGEKDEPRLHQPPLRHKSSPAPSPSRSVISNESQSRTVPPSNFSPAVSDSSPIAMDSGEASRQPSYENDHRETNHGDLQQQTDLHCHHSSPFQSTTTNVFNKGFKFNPSHNGKISRPTMLAGSLHSQVPMTHGQVLNMVSRRDNNLFNYAITGHLESQRTSPDDLRAVNSGNGFAHPVATSHQEAEEKTKGHSTNENSSNHFHPVATSYIEAEVAKLADASMLNSGSSFIHPETRSLSEAQQTYLDYPSTRNSGSSMQETAHVSHRSLQGFALHAKPSSTPPDLNIRFQSSSSSTSGPVIDCQYPDLALQL